MGSIQNELKTYLLERHNEHRFNGGLNVLKWDDGLENQCEKLLKNNCTESNYDLNFNRIFYVEETTADKSVTQYALATYSNLHSGGITIYKYPGEVEFDECGPMPNASDVATFAKYMHIIVSMNEMTEKVGAFF